MLASFLSFIVTVAVLLLASPILILCVLAMMASSSLQDYDLPRRLRLLLSAHWRR
jgi:hypothetical protein